MNNEKPTKAQEKAWLQRVAEHGCVINGQSVIQLHHCVGREGKHNKYHIGRWFVLPLSVELHDVSSDHPHNVTHHRKEFVKTFGLESDLFGEMCFEMNAVERLPFDSDVLLAIMDTNR